MDRKEAERALEWASLLLESEKDNKATYEDFCGTGDLEEEEREDIYAVMDIARYPFTQRLLLHLQSCWMK